MRTIEEENYIQIIMLTALIFKKVTVYKHQLVYFISGLCLSCQRLDLWREKYNDVVPSDKRKRRINHMVYTPYISIDDYSTLLFMIH